MRVFRLILVLIACLLVAGSALSQDSARNPKRSAVGKLGQLKEKAPIYVKPDKRARVLYRGAAQLYVVMKNLTDDWATIVMADGSSGFVEAKFVESLPYDVNVKKPEVRQAATTYATRGGFDRSTRFAVAGDNVASSIVRMGLQYLGTPYKWGGNSLTAGVDCSGFVQQLFKAHGISLPRTAQEQSGVGLAIDSLDQLQTGDRLYFTDAQRARVTHTGIYMGNGYFVHSSVGNGRIGTDPLTARWIRILVAVRR